MTTFVPEGHVDLVANAHTEDQHRERRPSVESWNAMRRDYHFIDQARAQERAALHAQAVQ